MIKKSREENLHIRVGYACGNACVFCMESDRKGRYEKVSEFVKERIFEAMREGTGTEKIVFTTGEPTLNPKLPEYARYAKKLGYKKIAVVSNGRKLGDAGLAAKLLKGGLTEFIISVHGHNAEIHESLTRSKGSFSETKKGLENLAKFRKKIPFTLAVSHVVNKKNFKFLENFLRFCQKYPIDTLVLNVVQPRGGNMEKNFSELMPRYGDLAEIVGKLFFQKRELFISPFSKKPHVSVIDLPLCVLKNELLAGYGENILIEMKKKKSEPWTTAQFKRKRKECGTCKYSGVCDGVFESYVQHFGWDEFTPTPIF